MTGIIRKSEDVIQAVAPEWTTVHVVPRGTPRYIDQNLRGTLRYANRVGSFLPNIQPDNRIKTTEPIQALSQQIRVDRIIDGLVPGSLIQIAENEIQLVADVSRDQLLIQTYNLIKSSFDTGASIDLYGEAFVSTGVTSIALPKASTTITQGLNTMKVTARTGGVLGNRIFFSIVIPTVPLTPFGLTVDGLDVTVTIATDAANTPVTPFRQVLDTINGLESMVFAEFTGNTEAVPVAFGSYLSGGSETDVLGVRGRFPVLIGDQLWIQNDPSLLLSGTPYTVVEVQGYSRSLSEYNTIVVLDNVLPRDLNIEDIVYLRGFPGYQSNTLTIPPHRRLPHPIGPFVVDYVSGRFTDGPSPVETLSLLTSDGLGSPIDSVYPVAVKKNHPILRVPIHQSAFLFFHRYCGVLTYRNDKLVMRNDDRGRCEIWVDLIPAWPAPVAGQDDLSWTTRVTFASGEVNALYYQFEPNEAARVPGYPDQLLAAGSGAGNAAVNVQISLKVGQQDATRLRLVTSGPPNGEIEMDSWNVTGRHIEQLQYGLSARQVGAFDWQAGSLQIKPYFKTIADLCTQMDVDSLDSGTLLL
jgi:hypothetical protein